MNFKKFLIQNRDYLDNIESIKDIKYVDDIKLTAQDYRKSDVFKQYVLNLIYLCMMKEPLQIWSITVHHQIRDTYMYCIAYNASSKDYKYKSIYSTGEIDFKFNLTDLHFRELINEISYGLYMNYYVDFDSETRQQLETIFNNTYTSVIYDEI